MKLRAQLSEIIGTFVLVFVTSGVCGLNQGALISALLSGFILFSLYYVIAPLSGCHLNPAVTLSLVLFKKIKIIPGLLYMIGQCIGAFCGVLAAWGILSGVSPSICCTALNTGLRFGQAFALQIGMSALFSLVYLRASVSRGTCSGIRVGLLFTALLLLAYPLLGCVINPAHFVGLGFFMKNWHMAAVFVGAPFCGSIIGWLLFKLIFNLKSTYN